MGRADEQFEHELLKMVPRPSNAPLKMDLLDPDVYITVPTLLTGPSIQECNNRILTSLWTYCNYTLYSQASIMRML